MQINFLFHAATDHPGGFYYWKVYLNNWKFFCEELNNMHSTILFNAVEIGVSDVDEINNIKDLVLNALDRTILLVCYAGLSLYLF
jgi:hypothetical protein